MGVNRLPKTVTRQRRGCDLNPGPSAPESSTLTTRLRLNSTTRARPDPRGPARTRTDPTEFLGDPGRKKVRAGPCGSGRARVVEFSYYRATSH